MSAINVTDAISKMLEAGLPVIGMASNGRIDFDESATDLQRLQAEEFLKNYDQSAVDAEKEVVVPPTKEEILAVADLDEIKTLFIRLLESLR